MQTSEITLEHPAGRVRVQVPTDVRLEELMPDFLDVAAQPDRDDWALGAADGPPYPPHLTLAQLGVREGSVLVLHTDGNDHRSAPEVSDETRGAPRSPVALNGPAVARTGSEHDEDAALRPVTARSACTLPEHLSTAQRLATAGRALLTRTPRRARERRARPTGVPDPALFALPARVSRLARMRQAWQLSDYERLLEQLILAPHLRRCVTIAELYPEVVDGDEEEGGVPSRLLKTEAGDGRQEGTPWWMFAGSPSGRTTTRSRSRSMTSRARVRGG